MTADTATLTVEQIGFVRRLTLNRPDQHNPLTPRAVRDILQAVAAAESDEHVRVVVIRSTGRSFSSGYGFVAEDVEPGDFVPHAAIEGDVTAMLDLASGWAKVWDCAIPVIAQVQGNCLAGGTDLALHCDLVIAAEDARIGFPTGAFDGRPTHQHVAVPPRTSVDQAAAAHGRHRDRSPGRSDGIGRGHGAIRSAR